MSSYQLAGAFQQNRERLKRLAGKASFRVILFQVTGDQVTLIPAEANSGSFGVGPTHTDDPPRGDSIAISNRGVFTLTTNSVQNGLEYHKVARLGGSGKKGTTKCQKASLTALRLRSTPI